jgi:hypothetical protein
MKSVKQVHPCTLEGWPRDPDPLTVVIDSYARRLRNRCFLFLFLSLFALLQHRRRCLRIKGEPHVDDNIMQPSLRVLLELVLPS